jgi:hypothetical protein
MMVFNLTIFPFRWIITGEPFWLQQMDLDYFFEEYIFPKES